MFASPVKHNSTPAPHSPSLLLSLSPNAPQSPSLLLLCSLEALPSIDTSEYTSIPDSHTVVHHPPYNFPALGIVINTHFHCIICLNCEHTVDTSNLIEHICHELPCCKVLENLPSVLQASYNLVPYSRIIYPLSPTLPIFGILLHLQPIFFLWLWQGLCCFWDIVNSSDTHWRMWMFLAAQETKLSSRLWPMLNCQLAIFWGRLHSMASCFWYFLPLPSHLLSISAPFAWLFKDED